LILLELSAALARAIGVAAFTDLWVSPLGDPVAATGTPLSDEDVRSTREAARERR
jgi:hypothetical protein